MSGDNERAPTLPTIVGIGAGTGLLGLANTIPDSYPFLKHLAVYAAPTATIGVQWGWIFFAFWVTALVTKKTADYGVRKIRVLRDEALADPHATDDHKHEMQEQCEKLEKIAAESIANNVKNVHDKFKPRDA